VRFEAATAECLVFTTAEGVLSALAHDLKLKVEAFTLAVDETTGAVVADFDPASVRVVCAMRGEDEAEGALGARDARTIAATIAREVLEVARYPAIRFHAPGPPRHDAGESGLRIDGTLLLHGTLRDVAIHAARHGKWYVGEARLHQPDFGIRPYSAMLGTLRVAPDVRVRIAIPLEP
jgi:polyisoprenoid-binding protein YceI